ncbi:MAG TPA: hypothetical protein VK987_11225 [Anaerolineae bacterium]|jgi:hypothetical protein|nr:hypothetical protein [Anaerolineae bacterium]
MDEQRRISALEALADEATRLHDEFVDQAGREFVRFLDANRSRLEDLGGLVLIDEEPEYLSVTDEGTFRSRTRYRDDAGEWVTETEEIEDPAELVEIYNPADLYAAFADAARDEAGLDADRAEDEQTDGSDSAASGGSGDEAGGEADDASASDDDWAYDVPTPRDEPDAARLLYDLALTFQERSQLDQAQLLDDFQDASHKVAAMLGDRKVVEDEDERLWFRSTGAFEGEVVPERDEDAEGEPEWQALTTPDDLVQFYDPTDLFGDLAESIAQAWPEVAPELADGDEDAAEGGDGARNEG